MNEQSPSLVLPIMIQAAETAGDILRCYFSQLESLQVKHKQSADFVSQADIEAEQSICDILQQACPDYGILREEGDEIEGDNQQYQWIIDPLDGTTNFIFGIPHFAVSIALCRSGTPIAGVVLNPVQQELYVAALGEGATLNGKSIAVAMRTDLPSMLLGTGLPFKDKSGHEAIANELVAPMQQTAGIRRIGAAALDLCYVACGRFDAFWEHDLQPWDVAAGVLLVREAGGIVTRLDGSDAAIPSSDILAASKYAYKPVKLLFE